MPISLRCNAPQQDLRQLAQGQVTEVIPGDQAKSVFIQVGIQGPGDSGIGGTQTLNSALGITAGVTEDLN